jgi:predicted enzyme related to lactoylglutathione lyase
MAGEIVHIEINADDTAQAQTFYSGLFGWEFAAYPGGPNEYLMTRIGDASGAAITNAEPGKQGTRTYFAVDDIRAGAARVRELGGHADEPMPVPGMGWFATCRDPHGNAFGIWQTDESAPGA